MSSVSFILRDYNMFAAGSLDPVAPFQGPMTPSPEIKDPALEDLALSPLSKHRRSRVRLHHTFRVFKHCESKILRFSKTWLCCFWVIVHDLGQCCTMASPAKKRRTLACEQCRHVKARCGFDRELGECQRCQRLRLNFALFLLLLLHC
jgi:hypothetical protein